MSLKKTPSQDNETQLDPIMKAIKAVRSNGGTADPNSIESIEKQRRAQERMSKFVTPGITVDYEQGTVKGDEPIPTIWARPQYAHRTDRIILYCHGGGFTCGELGYAGILAGKLASHTGLPVISYSYRLAPENPYPAAVRDTMTVWNHLMYRGYGADDIILAGDSAGGNLALELTLMLKKEKRKLPRGIILMSPWTDMTITSDSFDKMKDLDPMLTKEYVLGVRDAYIYGRNKSEVEVPIDYADPVFSPLFGDLDDFPPVYIQAGSNEILQDDSVKLYNKLKGLDCTVKMDIYDGGWHVFQQMPTRKAYKAMEDIKEFVQKIV